jgi:Fe-S cluster biogenesis protein NfuA
MRSARLACGRLVVVVDTLDRDSAVTKVTEKPKPEASDVGVTAEVTKALSAFVADLVRADGGELYLVSATSDDVHLHLTGTCAGCPGATMTRDRLLEPAVHGAAPKATVKVTTGWRVPEGARRVE